MKFIELKTSQIRLYQEAIILNLVDVEAVIDSYEGGKTNEVDLLEFKAAIAWTIMESPMISINLSLEDKYSKILKYVINNKKLNKLDTYSRIVD